AGKTRSSAMSSSARAATVSTASSMSTSSPEWRSASCSFWKMRAALWSSDFLFFSQIIYLRQGALDGTIPTKSHSGKSHLQKEEFIMNKYAGTQTEKNLQAAFSGESEARNKYTYFA